ncbi:Cof-type HAD-IIB family hydrolase [Heyndrickxia acidicola]|uniref:Cof-type HAD-IIB family hydrolase n=1 Tax=Heyndrickxia acidicola TaxID=209389 RepID=A0ABU6MDW0_9BACI|nr:Cof-type HAD-IIB family hydrolase [Heyndrickxia acidicola]MED1202855.1 Cof-type HAD-IIB family hydrolase [Heyndrickxia acidicola]
MIRCIASDMDGTLLNSRQEITEENRQAILKAQEQGIEFVVATGRSYQEAHMLLKEAGIKCAVIGVNGAEIRDEEGNIEGTNSMPASLSVKVAEMLNQIGIYFELYTNQGTYSENYDKNVEILVDILKTANPERSKEAIREKVKERASKKLLKTVTNYKDILENQDQSVYKMIAFSNVDEMLKKCSIALQEFEEIKVTSSGHGNLEINYIGAQKGIALEDFTSKRGITLIETMALGDNFNDLPMLKKVGYPVAMGNAEPEVKEFCRYQTVLNDDSGVGKAILKALESNQKQQLGN